MTRVLVVSVEPPWPAHHGGRLRTARVVEAMSRDLDVLVAYPDHGAASVDPPVAIRPLAWSPVSAARSRISTRPHLGGHFLHSVSRDLLGVCREFRPAAVYWSHSYLAAWAPPELRAIPQIIEFANIESRRLRTLARNAKPWQRPARAAEAAKARLWEPRIARSASLCVALSESDDAVLRRWTPNVVLVPNGVDLVPYEVSPAQGYVLAIASYDYEPNVRAVRDLVRDAWPLVRQRLPGARLVVAGRASEHLRAEFAGVPGVTVLGSVDEVGPVYAGAAVCVAPASTGGGSQLKLTEALSRGRCVVMSPFAARGLPDRLAAGGGHRVADGPAEHAAAIIEALDRVADRHRRERSDWELCQLLSWPQVIRPLTDALAGMMTRSGAS
jgi:glycosyltransferase involved in cell wall biosynthesis